MGEFSRAGAAIRAGVDVSYIETLIELAIITTDAGDQLTKGDVLRAQMAQTLETGSVPLESLAASIRNP